MLRNISKYQENGLKVHKVRLEEPLFSLYFYWKPCKKTYILIKENLYKNLYFQWGPLGGLTVAKTIDKKEMKMNIRKDKLL